MQPEQEIKPASPDRGKLPNKEEEEWPGIPWVIIPVTLVGLQVAFYFSELLDQWMIDYFCGGFYADDPLYKPFPIQEFKGFVVGAVVTYLFIEIIDQWYVSFRGDFINDVDPGDDLEE